MRLVADIGGTNARVALSADGVIDEKSIQRFSNADWTTLNDLLRAYRRTQLHADFNEMVIAVAGPVYAGQAKLTNRNWTINADEMKRDFACKSVVLLNDLGALGYAVPKLSSDHVRHLCGDVRPRDEDGQALVVGVGTGFNISQVITKKKCTVCPPAEAGHISMPSSILSELADKGYHVDQFRTVEDLFSGRGLTAFCRLVTNLDTITGETAMQTFATACGELPVKAAIDLYAKLLGLLLRDLSLAYLPSQGIFLAGSVARAVARCASEPLISILRRPCKVRVQEEPLLFVVEADGAALLGVARYG